MEIAVGKRTFTESELNNVETALKVNLSEYNKNLIMNGNSSDLIEIDGRECKLSLQRNKKGEVLAVVNNKKEALEIPHEIQGTKLSRNDKKMLFDGHSVLLNTKNGDFYLQIDKELNTVTIKGAQEMGIPDVIGDNKKQNYKGYQLTNADKELLANGHMLPPRVLCSKDGYILTEFGLTEDRKGVKFAHTISIPKNEVQNYIEKYNLNGVSLDKVSDKELNESIVDTKDLNVVSSKAGVELEVLTIDKTNIGPQISEELPEKIETRDKLQKEGDDIQKQNIQSEKTLPTTEKEVVVRNLDKEFMAALEVRDFKKLNDLAKDDNYDPSKKTLETAHQLPNLSDADKVAIKTIFPEKENEPTLDPKSNEPVLDILHNKKNNVIVKEEEREKQGNIKEKLGHIISGAFQSM